MVFSSAIFLFAFLPIIFIAYRLVYGQRCKNTLLILFSLIFYAFGNLTYIPLLLFSVLCNYIAGLLVARPGRGRTAAFAVAMVVNLALLCTFKYLDFLITNLNAILGVSIPLAGITLPIGISFFTFQGMSYVFDVYRHPETGTRSFSKVLLYISLFPQLVAGPIVKYLDVAHQIDDHPCTPQLTCQGIGRFIVGMSKKLLIANTLGLIADQVFSLSSAQLDWRSAWLGAICYTLQIYFDFSGYSDMAIGLGKMFGFHFNENFNYPYTARTVKQFWDRWHISLSTWFREYLYFPIGGNRRGAVRTQVNRLIVFFCTGLWHGASWTFVLWGMWHGLCLTLEDSVGLRQNNRLPVLGHIYTMLVVIVGFVLFRADTIAQAGMMFRAMFTGFTITAISSTAFWNIYSPALPVALLAGVLCSVPLGARVYDRLTDRCERLTQAVTYSGALLLLVLNIMNLASTSFNPFIYFQF